MTSEARYKQINKVTGEVVIWPYDAERAEWLLNDYGDKSIEDSIARWNAPGYSDIYRFEACEND